MSDTGETFHRIGLEQDNAELQRVNTELVWVVQDLISELREEAAAVSRSSRLRARTAPVGSDGRPCRGPIERTD